METAEDRISEPEDRWIENETETKLKHREKNGRKKEPRAKAMWIVRQSKCQHTCNWSLRNRGRNGVKKIF